MRQVDGETVTFRRTDYLYNEAWQVLEERAETFDDLEGEGGARQTPAETVAVQWLWDIRYVDAPVLRWRDADAQSGNGLEETVYYVTDANWNVTALVGADGTVLERYMYDPHGKTAVLEADWTADADNKSDVANEIQFAGYRLNPETGLHLARSRYYDVALSVWTARDSMGYVDGMNLYQYCRGNSTGMTDPMGLEEEELRSGADETGGTDDQENARYQEYLAESNWHGGGPDESVAKAAGTGFLRGLWAGATNLARAFTLGQVESVNNERDKAWNSSGLAGTWVETVDNYGSAATAVTGYAAVGLEVAAVAGISEIGSVPLSYIGTQASVEMVALMGGGGATASTAMERPQTGQLFERTLTTSAGPVDVLAEVEVSGNTLLLRDIAIYGRGPQPLTGITRDLFAARTELIEEVRAMGFDTLRITGQRTIGSTSASPGKVVDVVVDLTKH